MEWLLMGLVGSLAVIGGYLAGVLGPAIADRIRYGRRDRGK